MRFRGTVLSLSYAEGFFRYLNFLGVLLVAFKAFVDGTSRKLKICTERLAQKTPVGRVVYLSGNQDKQEVIKELIKKHAITESYTGLIAVVSCVENCSSFELRKNAQTKKLVLTSAFRKCLHYYLYIRDPQLGLFHIRIMTWFPLAVQICLNGREWLARQLDSAKISYRRLDNTFEWVSDFAAAQRLFDRQLQADWPALLSGLLVKYHPEFMRLQKNWRLHDYYWTAEQTEWATDVSFSSPQALQALYRRLVRHATENLSSADVMRFLQQSLTKSGQIRGNFKGEITTDSRRRAEGVRVKHRLGLNSLKMYDKFGVVLRIEVTIHNTYGLKVYRPKASDPDGKRYWQPLRRGVADFYRRCELSQKANELYLEALSVVEVPETLESLVTPVSKARQRKGRRYRGLNLMSVGDRQLLKAINRGEYAITGFRNRDLREALFGKEPQKGTEKKKQTGQVTRRLQLLRAHGLIAKIPKSHRYQITSTGRKLASALGYASDLSLKTLSQVA
jgi:hypothetical protein